MKHYSKSVGDTFICRHHSNGSSVLPKFVISCVLFPRAIQHHYWIQHIRHIWSTIWFDLVVVVEWWRKFRSPTQTAGGLISVWRFPFFASFPTRAAVQGGFLYRSSIISSKFDGDPSTPEEDINEMQDLMFELDCEKEIGEQKFFFYFPIEVADFVVMLWRRASGHVGQLWDETPCMKAFETAPHANFALSIYEHGSLVSNRDTRFAASRWNGKLKSCWSEEIFTKNEVGDLLDYLRLLSRAQSGC